MTNRRGFIKNTAALATLSVIAPVLNSCGIAMDETEKEKKRIFPQKLKKGNTIGLITPGSPITKKQLDEAVNKLKNKGFKVYYKDTVLSKYGYLAGKDKERADELMGMFSNENVDAIMCVRGGYGSIRILNKLDFKIIQANPKILIGYSDITALISTIYQKTGLVTFHGLLGVSPFNDFSYKAFEAVLINPTAIFQYPYLREPETTENSEFDQYTINNGIAEGELIGGNISVIDSMIGSDFEPDFENKIVFLEEIEEKTYRVDKMLYHLLYATNLKKASGIALGVFSHCNINDEPRLTLKQAIEDLFKPLKMPISYGLPFGHIDNIVTIPTGVKARLDANNNTLTLLEMAVV